MTSLSLLPANVFLTAHGIKAARKSKRIRKAAKRALKRRGHT